MFPPNVVIVAGPAASGKTTFATRLALRSSSCLFDLDQITAPLVQQCLALLDQPEYALDQELGRTLRPARYDSLLAAATANIVLGRDVVIAAPFSREISSPPAWQRMVARWSSAGPSSAPVNTELLYVQCPPALLRERLVRRGEPRDRLKIESGADLSSPAPVVEHHVVDGAADLDREVDRLLDELHGGRPPVRVAGV